MLNGVARIRCIHVSPGLFSVKSGQDMVKCRVSYGTLIQRYTLANRLSS